MSKLNQTDEDATRNKAAAEAKRDRKKARMLELAKNGAIKLHTESK